jgi:hypothetical protein
MTTVSAEDRAELEIMRNRGYRVVPGSTGYGATVINPATVTSSDRYPGRPDLGTREDVSIDASTAISVPWDTPTGASAEAMQAALEKHRIRQEAKIAAAGDGEPDGFEEPIGDLGDDPLGGGGDEGNGGGDARNQEIANTFKDAFIYGLQEVGLDTETIDKLWTWAESRFTGDASFTAAQAMIEVYDQQAFKDRFPGIEAMRADPGRRDIPLPAEYLAREKWLATQLEQYGMAALGADINNLVAESFMNTIGEGELLERIQEASRLINEAPQEVRDTFGDWYGPHGDAALMAAFLDPDDAVFGGEWKNWATLKSGVATAEIGGWSRMMMGLDTPITQERAGSIAKLGLDQATIWRKFSTVKEQENLFVEKIGEVSDLSATEEGVEAAFGLDLDAADALERRRGTRAAEFAGGGGAMITGSTTGFGAANV